MACVSPWSTSPGRPKTPARKPASGAVISRNWVKTRTFSCRAAISSVKSSEERQLRHELADFYHLVDYMGWTELIFNHISVRLPGTSHHYLVNPFGLNYSEVTSENLLKVSADGHLVEPSDYAPNPADFALRLLHKDVSLACQLARDVQVPMRLTNMALMELTEAMNRGWGARDSRVGSLLQQERAGIPPIAVAPDKIRSVLESDAK